MDALSPLLRMLRPERARFFDARLGEPVRCAALPGRLTYYHVVEGRCTLALDGREPLALSAGDIALVPHGDAHRVRAEGGGAPRLVFGELDCDRALGGQVLAMMPRTVAVDPADDERVASLQALVASALAQASAQQAGAQWALAKASEMLLVEALRLQLARLPLPAEDWLAGLGDRIVGRCLAVMHERPADKWTLERLAREASTSRSVLAQRFSRLVGQPPMGYLARWRMALAADLLCDSSLGLMRIAEEVGYETDTALIRAFRREFGVPPVAWRRARQDPAESVAL